MLDRIRQLFYGSHSIDRRAVKECSPDEIDRLRAIVRGEEASQHRARAFAALTATGAEDVPEILAEVLDREDEDVAFRSVAATQLGRYGGPEAERFLVRSLPGARHLVLRTKIAAALGRAGTRNSLGALERLARGNYEAPVRRQSAFALALIAHREGIRGHEVAPPADSEFLQPPREMIPFAIRRADSGEVQTVKDSLARNTYGINLAEEVAFRFKCGRTQHLLALNSEHVRGDFTGVAVERPILFGLVAQRAPEDGSYSVARLVLAGPAARGQIYIAVYRTDGTLVHFGRGWAVGEAGEFGLTSVNARGNVALEVHGTFRGSELVFTETRVAADVNVPSTPERLELPRT